jgi:hypothetical protein
MPSHLLRIERGGRRSAARAAAPRGPRSLLESLFAGLSPHIRIFMRSFPLRIHHYAAETIAEICSMWDALATAMIIRTGSWP